MRLLIDSGDPSENKNLANSKKSVVEMMLKRLLTYIPKMIPADYPKSSKKGHPKHFKGIWSPGWCKAK